MNLPDKNYYQYFSHLFDSESRIPFKEYVADTNWDYSESDLIRYNRIFLNEYTQNYIKDQNVLDLGCHVGYFSYISKHLGANSVHGINIRKEPIDIANYVFAELAQDNYLFEIGNIEDNIFLSKVCDNKDTVILTLVLEHLRNPYVFLETITNSSVKNLIFESSIYSDSGAPGLQYYRQTTANPYTVYDGNKSLAIGCVPNMSWIDMILYSLGWKIERYEVYYDFNKNWFGTKGLDLQMENPILRKVVMINATKFN